MKSAKGAFCSPLYLLLGFLGAMALWVGNRATADTTAVSDADTLYFAQMADGGGYITRIVLANPGAIDINATLEPFQSDGTPLTITMNGATGSSFTWTVKARGSLFLKTSGTGSQVSVGWIRVRGTGPIGGSLVYSYLSGGRAVSEAGLDPSAPMTQFCYTVDTRQHYYSGLAVANPNSTSLEVRYALYDSNGNLKGRSTQPLGAMQHTAKLLEEIFSGQNLVDFTGTVTAISVGGSMVATTLRFDPEVGTLASIPVITGLAITSDSTTTSTTTSQISTTTTTPPLVTTTISTSSTSTTTTTSTSTTTTTLQATVIYGNVDSPKEGTVVTTTSLDVSGWALSNYGVANVFVIIDGNSIGNATYGKSRPDICSVYPSFAACASSGYLKTINIAGFSAGLHTLRVRIQATNGEQKLIPNTPIHFTKSSESYTAGSLYTTDSIVGNLRYVPAGTFIQGSPSTEAGRLSDEGPQFQHTMMKNMAVMETEVTREMWADLRAEQGTLPADPTYTDSGSGMNNPVQCVTWYQTVLFANLLSLQSGLTRAYYVDAGFSTPITSGNFQTDSVYVNWNANGYRLPTEGEWEYFTRAGTTMPFSINEPAYNTSTSESSTAGVLAALESVAWFYSNAGSGTHPVGSKAANPWGLKDVHGNVWEWCWDWWSGNYPGSGQTDYRGPSTGSGRMLRGGGWVSYPRFVRSGGRYHGNPGYEGNGVGFRLLRSVN